MSNYSRKITEILPQTKKLRIIVAFKFFEMVFLLFSLLLFAILSIIVVLLYKKNETMVKKRLEAQEKLIYWEKMTKKYPSFAKSYYMAAIYSMDFNKNQKAIDYLDKAIEIDPDFIEAISFREEIIQ